MITSSNPKANSLTTPSHATVSSATLDAKKHCVVGSAGSGKTALVNRFVRNEFSPDYLQTFGADLVIRPATDLNTPNLNIWCCGGQERYRQLLEQFYTEVQVMIIVFDMCSAKSFIETTYWYNEWKRCSPSATVFLVGTKVDQGDSVIVQQSDAMKQAEVWNVRFFAVSSKTGTNVSELWETVLKENGQI